jgi:beta-galactosidase
MDVDGAEAQKADRAWPAGRAGLRYGGDYNPEQWPRETWPSDIALMQQAGVNLVSVGIFSWALLEPQEGVYDFTFLDEVMDLLAEAGIDVNLGTPTAAPPAWFWKKHPEALPVTRDGIRLGYGARGIANPSSVAYRRAAASITRALAERYAAHPALKMWHVHNEYGAPVTEDYSAESVVAFREWLERRYGTIAELNRCWGTAFWGQSYGSFDEVDAPRTAATVVNSTQRLDFARFSSDALLQCFVMERDIIRQFTPDLPVTTNFMATNCGSVDYWAWAKEVDVVANDYYLVGERSDNHILAAMDSDLTRSLAQGRPWMLMEHSTSAVNWQPRNIAKRPGELARNSLSSLARGADAIMFFQWRASRFGAEKFHSAMLPHEGVTSRIWKEVTELGARLGTLAELQNSRVRAEVAILWDVESFWAQDLEYRPSVELNHRERIIAFYSQLWNRGVTVDFRHPTDDLSDYTAVLMPASYLVSDAGRANLERYVEGGGNLVVSYFSGIVDEHDTVPAGGYPGQLRSLLGIGVAEWLPFPEGETAELSDGSQITSWAEDLIIESGAAVVETTYAGGRAGTGAAIVRNSYGAGRTWYLSTKLDGDDLGRLLARALQAAGVRVPDSKPGLEQVTRSSEAHDYTFLINHTDQDISSAVPGVPLTDGRPDPGAARPTVVPAGDVIIIRADRSDGTAGRRSVDVDPVAR